MRDREQGNKIIPHGIHEPSTRTLQELKETIRDGLQAQEARKISEAIESLISAAKKNEPTLNQESLLIERIRVFYSLPEKVKKITLGGNIYYRPGYDIDTQDQGESWTLADINTYLGSCIKRWKNISE